MSLYVDDEIPRYQDDNLDNLTELEKTKREREIKQILLMYPNAEYKIAEMAWNYIHREGVENVRDKINSGFFNKPSKYANPPGGTIKSGYVYNPDGSLYDPDVDDNKESFERGENIISC